MLGDLGKKREGKEVSGIKDIIPVFPFPDFCKQELEHSVREFNTEVKGCPVSAPQVGSRELSCGLCPYAPG